MNTTANLGLSLPEGSDYADIAALDANFQKLDAVVLAAKSAEEYDTAATYAVGVYRTKDGKLYRCTTAITAAEAWNAAHWAETSVGQELTGKAALNHTHTASQVGAMPVSPATIEMLGGTDYGGLIDFHFNGSSEDFTTRLIEGSSGKLSVVGNMNVTGVMTIEDQKAATVSNLTATVPISCCWKSAAGRRDCTGCVGVGDND